MEIEVKGLDKCIKMVQNLKNILNSKELFQYIAEKSIKIINRFAKSRLDQYSNYINSNKYKLTDNGIEIYNDVQSETGKHYSLIIEYGSGIYAEMAHIGDSKTFVESGYVYWLVPVEEGSNLENYGFEVIDIDLGKGQIGSFYKVFGQQAKHIYTDAAKEIEQNLVKWTNEYINKVLKQ